MENSTVSRRSLWLNRLGIVLIGVGLVCALVSIWVFSTQLSAGPIPDQTPWRLYAASLLAWLGGILVLTRGATPSERAPFPWLLLPIVALALALRVSELNVLPYGIWFDEASNALFTRRILTVPDWRPVAHATTNFIHYAAYCLGMLVMGQNDIAGPRLVSALLGVGAVVLAYLVGRQLRDAWFGLLFAFIMATLRWSINFSRIAMTGIDVPFFVLLTAWALLRLHRTGALRDALWVGASVGLGLWFYRAFSVMLIPLGLYALLLWPWRAGRRRVALMIAVGGVTVGLLVHPLGLAAVLQPDTVIGRTQQVSIFSNTAGEPLPQILQNVTYHYLRMFHFSGDAQGRHNLPREPMLDPVTGILFAAGMVLALVQIRRRENLFFFLVLAFGLLTGILSLPSEAPTALRTLGVLPAVGYFVALALEAALKAAAWAARRLNATPTTARDVTIAAASLLAVPILAVNYDIYFRQQRYEFSVWSTFSTTATVAARWLAAQPSGTQVWVSPNTDYGMMADLLAPDRVAQVVRLDIPGALPIRTPAVSPVAILFASDQELYLDEVRRLYPHASIDTIEATDFGVQNVPPESNLLLYAVYVPEEDIAGVQGLVEGEGLLYAPTYGTYTLYVAPGGRALLDGTALADETRLLLAQGDHALTLDPPTTALQWIPPQGGQPAPVPDWAFYRPEVGRRGLMASYFQNQDWSGQPRIVRLEPFVYRYVHTVPFPRPFTVLWQGSLYAPSAGSYALRLTARERAWLSLDGEPRLDVGAPEYMDAVVLELSQGWHPLEMRMLDSENASRIYLEWQPPGEDAFAPITSEYLRP